MTASGNFGDGYVAVLRRALDSANSGLDILAMRGYGDLSIMDAEDEHLTWRSGPQGLTLRITGVATFPFRASAAGRVTWPDGTEVPPPPPPVITWHPSFRYYRLSQISTDIVDAYRNRWLAIESILDSISPKQGRESETSWLHRALGMAAQDVDLTDLLDGRIDSICRTVYEDKRNALFHAKTQRAPIMPRGSSSRGTLLQAHSLLAQLYLRLAGQYLDVRRPASLMTYEGFELATSRLDEELRMYVTGGSTDEAEVAAALAADDPILTALSTHRERRLERPGMKAFLGRTPGRSLPDGGLIAGLVAAAEHPSPVAMGKLEGVLHVGDVYRLEGHLGLRLENVEQPKEHYST